MPVNYEKHISGHDEHDEHDDEHDDEKGHLYKAQPTADLGTRYTSYSKDLVNHSNTLQQVK